MNAENAVHPSDGRPLFHTESQEEWRAWLEQNHEESDGVWLVSWKNGTGPTSVPPTGPPPTPIPTVAPTVEEGRVVLIDFWTYT